MRGEYPPQWPPPPIFVELPPRARRIRGQPLVTPLPAGTTSACAENTLLSPSLIGYHWELPPRARRIRAFLAETVQPFGTTSACAENTIIGVKTHVFEWNYLRVRGEYRKFFAKFKPKRELPPRARRIRTWSACWCPRRGTTSACAENTSSR